MPWQCHGNACPRSWSPPVSKDADHPNAELIQGRAQGPWKNHFHFSMAICTSFLEALARLSRLRMCDDELQMIFCDESPPLKRYKDPSDFLLFFIIKQIQFTSLINTLSSPTCHSQLDFTNHLSFFHNEGLCCFRRSRPVWRRHCCSLQWHLQLSYQLWPSQTFAVLE